MLKKQLHLPCTLLVSIFLHWTHAEVFQEFRLGESKTTPELDFVISRYLSNAELEQHMRGFVNRTGCSDISRLFTIGKSRNGTEMWGYEISNNPGKKEAKPNFKYVANMHGDEPTGRVLFLGLAEWLCANWKSSAVAKRMVEDVKLFLVPTLNPDGFALKQRGNLNGIDLNRNFPDPILQGGSVSDLQATGTEEPETLNVMNWVQSTHFVASASCHEGAFVANYPWDGSNDGRSKDNRTSDDATFRYLARSYASLDPPMNSSLEFPTGITNGAEWYPLIGGMQDWNYIVGKCMELTLELSMQKFPPASSLPSIWNDNLKSLINYPMTALFGGLRGFVLDSGNGDPLAANITVSGSNWTVSTDPEFGNFYRPLAPGKYTVTITSDGRGSNTTTILIPNDNTGFQQNFTLLKVPLKNRSLRGAKHQGLPRKLGGTEIIGSEQFYNGEDEDLLISQELWINMMQIAMYLLLGFVLSGLSVLFMLFLLHRYQRSRARFRS